MVSSSMWPPRLQGATGRQTDRQTDAHREEDPSRREEADPERTTSLRLQPDFRLLDDCGAPLGSKVISMDKRQKKPNSLSSPNRSEEAGGDVPPDSAAPASRGARPPGRQPAAQLRDAGQTSESACSLKVTIQQGGASREFTQEDETEAEQGAGLRCHMCGVTRRSPQLRRRRCASVQEFEEHMSGPAHLAKREAVTRAIGAAAHALADRRRRWCRTCQTAFAGHVVSHRQSKQHKACKRASRPFCAPCGRHLKTPRKFVEHMKSDEHRRQLGAKAAQEEELITVDAVGCFVEEAEPGREEEAAALNDHQD
ncbi:cip1-interacting zinc finger protein-like [Syngnathoides biaculeatus]|uniref:cip1-interacting zinc finger protein-like n=1 Tax=Syngnathoides biaculeatus TaxID=300417 RepID=UPI002ADD3E81|nr:cip1-interacting zinc finger protein-like [Syngnathoides biaculeatus]